MLILLPPSEGKAAPARRGRPVDLAALPHPELTPLRTELLDALAAASARPGAAAALGLSPGLADEVARNVHLRTTPARRAIDVYTGVLYAALDHASLDPAGRRRANRWVRVQSALWGPVGPTDAIAPYRLPMTANLPGLGTVAARWRAVLGPGDGRARRRRRGRRRPLVVLRVGLAPDRSRGAGVRGGARVHRGRRPPHGRLPRGQAHARPRRALDLRGRPDPAHARRRRRARGRAAAVRARDRPAGRVVPRRPRPGVGGGVDSGSGTVAS